MTYRIPYSAKGKGIAEYSNEVPSHRRRQVGNREEVKRSSYYHQERVKSSAEDFSAPPPKRITAPEMDITYLIEENQLTLMGRLTNPAAQRL